MGSQHQDKSLGKIMFLIKSLMFFFILAQAIFYSEAAPNFIMDAYNAFNDALDDVADVGNDAGNAVADAANGLARPDSPNWPSDLMAMNNHDDSGSDILNIFNEGGSDGSDSGFGSDSDFDTADISDLLA